MVNSGYGIDIDVKLPCQCAEAKFAVAGNADFANITHLLFIELCTRMIATTFRQAHVDCVVCIFKWCHPFEIVDAVIALVAVAVVDVSFVFGIGQERLRNQHVNSYVCYLVIFVQHHAEITGVAKWSSANLNVAVKETFDAPHVADAVKSLEADNVAPNFVRQVLDIKPNVFVVYQRVICRVDSGLKLRVGRRH